MGREFLLHVSKKTLDEGPPFVAVMVVSVFFGKKTQRTPYFIESALFDRNHGSASPVKNLLDDPIAIVSLVPQDIGGNIEVLKEWLNELDLGGVRWSGSCRNDEFSLPRCSNEGNDFHVRLDFPDVDSQMELHGIYVTIAEARAVHDEKAPLLGCTLCDLLCRIRNESLGDVGRECFQTIVVRREGGKFRKIVLAEFQSFAEGELMQILNGGDGENEGIVVRSRSPAFGVFSSGGAGRHEFDRQLIQTLGFDCCSSHTPILSEKGRVFEQRLDCSDVYKSACFGMSPMNRYASVTPNF